MRQANKLSACQSRMDIVFAGEPVVLDARGALFLTAHGILAVADLHLEKGSFFAARNRPVPRHDTHDTLQRLGAVIDHYRPQTVICLGDSFHDALAGERMGLPDSLALQKLIASVGSWIWLTGNHDPQIPAAFGGDSRPLHAAGALHLAHLPETPARPLIAGHYHPKLSLSVANARVSGRCFVYSEALLLMPAFGAYAGGLDARDGALAPLFVGQERRHVLSYRGKLWTVAPD